MVGDNGDKNNNNPDMKKLTYDEWYGENQDRIYIELAESGADREMEYDPEEEFNQRYQEYLNTKSIMKNLKSSRYRSYGVSNDD